MDDQDQDEIEYHVTFPSPTPSSDAVDVDDEFENRNKEEATVVLIGWLNCEDQCLAKYSWFYEQKQCTTIRFSLCTEQAGEKAPQVAKKLLEVIVEMNLDDNQVLFHIFSNDGCHIYQHMLNDPQFKNVKLLGLVFDSAPTETRLWSVLSNIEQNESDSQLSYMKSLFSVSVKHIWQLIGRMSGYYKPSMYTVLKTLPPEVPELYLFSKADKTSWGDIDYLITHRKYMGADVQHFCWEDSPLLECNRETYKKHCHDFLSHCIQPNLPG